MTEHNQFVYRSVYCPLCKVQLTCVDRPHGQLLLVHPDPSGNTWEHVDMFGSSCPNTGVYEPPTVLLRKLERFEHE